MRHLFLYFPLAICAMTFLSSCQHDEPANPIKPVNERKVLLLTSEGHIYDQTGNRIKELPNCEDAAEIISDGDDYFVSGTHAKGKVGYWKNGKWNTLHVDFIDDVEHKTQGIGKYDYNIYLYDYPHVLRNSGIFPLEDYETFITTNKCLTVSEGKCYVVGWDFYEGEGQYHDAVLYRERKGKYVKDILPKPRADVDAAAFTAYAYDATHTIVGGYVGQEPCIWVDNQLQILPRTYDVHDDDELGLSMASVNSVTRTRDHIYAAGSEFNEERKDVATLWIDGVPTHLLSGEDGLEWSWIIEIISYGDDLYALSLEFIERPNGEADVDILIWLNGSIIAKYNNIDIVNFTVL